MHFSRRFGSGRKLMLVIARLRKQKNQLKSKNGVAGRGFKW
jgi:hypothetical protein